MPFFIQLRDRFRVFVSKHEYLIRRLWNGILMLIGMTEIGRAFPVDGVFGSLVLTWVVVILSAFLPLSGCMLVLAIMTILHIAVSSSEAAIVVAIALGIGYLILANYQSKAGYELVLLPVFQQAGMPFVVPMTNGLVGKLNDVAGVVAGGFISYMMKTISENLALLTDQQSSTSVFSILMSKMLQNREFYFYLVSVIAVFLITYGIRTMHIRFSWFIAVVTALVVELAIMVAGCLFSGNRDAIGHLILGNVLTLVVGLVLTYFLMDLNYSRIENVQFEDDDYYYYVTAVPKVHMPEEEKTVKKITK